MPFVSSQLADTTSQVIIAASNSVQRNIEVMRDCVVYRGGTIYTFTNWSVSSAVWEWRCYASDDEGATWAELDSANRPTFNTTTAIIVAAGIQPHIFGQDVIQYGANVYCLSLDRVDNENVRIMAFKFDTATETWDTSLPAGPTGQHISETFGDTSLFALMNTHRHLVGAMRGDELVVMRNFLFNDGGTFKIYPTVSVFDTVSETWTASIVKATATADSAAFSMYTSLDARANGDLVLTALTPRSGLAAGGGPVATLKAAVLSSSNVLTVGSTILQTVYIKDTSGTVSSGSSQLLPFGNIISAGASAPYSMSVVVYWPTGFGLSLATTGSPAVCWAEMSTTSHSAGPWTMRPIGTTASGSVVGQTPLRRRDDFYLYVDAANGASSSNTFRPLIMARLLNGFYSPTYYYRRNGLSFGKADRGYLQAVVGPRIASGYALLHIGDFAPDRLLFETVPVEEAAPGEGYPTGYFVP